MKSLTQSEGIWNRQLHVNMISENLHIYGLFEILKNGFKTTVYSNK